MADKRDRKAQNFEPQPIAGRVPPHDLDAEGAVLAAVLLEREALDTVLSFLKPEHFYSDANKRIFEACVTLAANGAPVDIQTVASWLRSREWIGQIGGPSYLAQIVDATPSVANVGAHAKVVHDKWRVRQVIGTCQRIAAEGYGDVGDDVGGFMQDAAASLSELAVGDVSSRGVDAADLLKSTFQKWAEPEKYDNGIKVRSGVRSLDARLRAMRGGNLVVVGAHSGIGKTALARTIAVNVARESVRTCSVCGVDVEHTGRACPTHPDAKPNTQRQCVLFFALEMENEEVIEAIAFSMARVDNAKIDPDKRHLITSEEWQRISKAAEAVSKLPLRIVDDADDMETMRAIAIAYKREVEKRGDRLAAVVIDYAQIAKAKAIENANESREQAVAAVGRSAKRMAKKLGCPVILPAQLNEDSRKENRKPRASDLRESRGLMNDADKVILIFNPFLEARIHAYTDASAPDDEPDTMDCAELIIAKNRKGKTGIVRVAFYPAYASFMDWPEGQAYPIMISNDERDANEVRRGRGRPR